ncbi:MAG TPA: TatD family hydrolase [Candidatus Enterenecus merdae]|nr:TatD family hydrolase [Candidatus Enterenecus merdae]
MLFDTHAHYDAKKFDADRDQVLSALPGQGVSLVLNPGCDLPSSRTAISLADRYPFLYAAVGVHPEDCGDWEEGWLSELRQLAAHPKVRAIGEIGLDYYWKDNPPRDLQQEVFRRQLELAGELGLPAIVHDRDAHGDCLAIVGEYPQVTGVFHCFSGSAQMARELVARGWMISFTGVLTYSNARRAVEAAQAVGLEHILIETDSPYMAPEPCRGRRCDSSLVAHTCRRLAQIKGVTPEECARITLANGKRLFGLS